MADHQVLVSQFCDITGVDDQRARFYLESSAWQLDVALGSFYENDNDSDDIGLGTDDNNPGMDPVLADMPPEAPKEEKPVKKGVSSSSSSRFATLASLRAEDSSSDEEHGQAFYAGGSERSGQQVLGPGGKKKDIISEMFKSAKEHGAEMIDHNQAVQKGSTSTFSGTGYRLGQLENDSQVIHGSGSLPSSSSSSSASSGPSSEPKEVTLKLWKNGFSVVGGPLRDYMDPDNKDFLDSIQRGEVPLELTREAKGGEVYLTMEDHRNEEFVPQKLQIRAFSGKGNILGSPAPSTVPTSHSQGEEAVAANEAAPKNILAVNHSEPTTNIQIRLSDGSRLVSTFNHTHTVADLRRYINTTRPQYASQVYILMTTFPNKELAEDSQTLKGANLLNATIVQRLKKHSSD